MTAETFELDTSGSVTLPASMVVGRGATSPLTWEDLSPFVQGYIRAAFTTPHPRSATGTPMGEILNAAFSDLHPDTLESMLADCERMGAHLNGLLRVKYGYRSDGLNRVTVGAPEGAMFWTQRQAGKWRDRAFPPLRPSLDPNGKVIAHG